ncbi:SDR family NAD(P)-dependent oxidoreductase [Fictibacillus phosphorivorans]|uniref:SDR family NAD(P)-dependent oxidoreductase n=1 Tax=Fictibacillus phosphorivorans TaxID=1221500 RepID=UPI003CFAFB12
MDSQTQIKEIIAGIENRSISPKDGYEIIQKLKSGMKAEQKPYKYKGIILNKPDSLGSLEVGDIHPDEPLEGEIQILVKAFSINFGDLLCAKGMYPTMPDYPFTPGFEVSGVVLKTGKGVTRFKVGDEVIALTGSRMGGHSFVVNTAEQLAVKKPPRISFEEACAFPVVFLAMQVVFEKANLKQGEKILIQTAAGGNGLLAVQMALSKGAEVFATAGSERKLEYLKQMGVHHTINYREEDFAQKVKELSGDYGVDAVINTLPGEAIQKGLDLLAPGGRYIEIAMMGLMTSDKFNLSNMVENQSFHSVNIRTLLTTQPEAMEKYLVQMVKVLEEGKLKPTVTKAFPFTKIKEAYRYLEEGQNIGKVVVITGQEQTKIENIPMDHLVDTNIVSNKDIAIIGVAGRTPFAKTKEDFWDMLAAGESSIKEIPPERWDINHFYDPDPKKLDKTYCKWGGVLEDIDQFDARFFNVSGKEAELTDPQQRLFLEECWNALEDAGYANDSISESKCGVFVGVSGGDYLNVMQQDGIPMEPQSFWGNASSVLASRISYLLNLKGPSIAIDTACSSSLVAIHLACQSIRAKESEMAIAGGVFISLTPAFNILSSNAGMLSPDGKCKTFDNGADGFVPGEAVGAVILKSYEQALKDKDYIYGVIKGTAINQDGRTNGLTAPSTHSQTKVELSAYQDGNINPETISYVEAHGTGTKLGDPIEVEALTNAFRNYTEKENYCAIGSIKTNIGHTAAAAGVASVIKVLLALKYKKIPPTINFKSPNEHIEFRHSPFYVSDQLQDWETPTDKLRRAAVSSFGFSGTNAHLVIEEFPEYSIHESKMDKHSHYLIPLSAKNEVALEMKVADLINWLENKEQNNFHLGDVAYTLACRRKHYPLRSIWIVQDIEDLLSQLKHSVHSKSFIGHTPSSENKQNRLMDVAMHYSSGGKVDWSDIYIKEEYCTVPLPSYPFQRQRYWYRKEEVLSNEKPALSIPEKIHPLLDKNISTFNTQQFETSVTGDEFFMEGHKINGQKMLPGMGYLEIAAAAYKHSAQKEANFLKNIVWSRPFTIEDQEKKLTILLNNSKDQAVDFVIKSFSDESQEIVHSRGKIGTRTINCSTDTFIDIQRVMSAGTLSLHGNESYKRFREIGFDYGEDFQLVKEFYNTDTEVVGFIELPDKLKGSLSNYILHPAIMDSALQTILGKMLIQKPASDIVYLPFSIGEVEILDSLESVTYSYAFEQLEKSKEGIKSYTIYLLDADGKILVKIKDFTSRATQTSMKKGDSEEQLFFKPEYIEAPLHDIGKNNNGTLLLFSDDERNKDGWLKKTEKLIHIKSGQKFKKIDSKNYEINPGNEEDYLKLAQDITRNDYPLNIVHMWSSHSDDILFEMDRGIYSLFFINKAFLQKSSKIHLLYVHSGNQPVNMAVGSFLKSIMLENPKSILCKSIQFLTNEEKILHSRQSIDLICKELRNPGKEMEGICYNGKKRLKLKLAEFRLEDYKSSPVALKDDGVYVITGGLGGIGIEIARYLAKKHNAKIILSGRSAIDEKGKEKLKQLNDWGAQAVYFQTDVSEIDQVRDLIQKVKQKFGRVNGIIHCAGLTKDSFAIQKTKASIREVFAPKVMGTLNLDRATKSDGLDFFILFSSIASINGNIGQSDYAYANSFMDHFSEWRKMQKRPGKTISINWPLWKDGGIRLDDQTEKLFSRIIGMTGITAKEGIDIIQDALQTSLSQFAAIKGNANKIRKWNGVFKEKVEANHNTLSPKAEKPKNYDVKAYFNSVILETASRVLSIDIMEIDLEDDIAEYGFDSLSFTDMANQLAEKFNLNLTPAGFFGHATLAEVANYIYDENEENITNYYREVAEREKLAVSEKEADLYKEKLSVEMTIETDSHKHELTTPLNDELINIPVKIVEKHFQAEPIAIIGMSGVMPQSDNLEEFWENLRDGKDMISVVPNDRWDWKEYYGDPAKEVNKTDVKWGGFMKETDKFDPLFFGISPREAELMDPQQRIFLQTVWKTIEDAGYRASDLSGSDTGLFVGVATSDYNEILQDTTAEIEAQTSTGMSHSMLANRISYLLNLHGPSEPVNTACSSSLVSIHRAVESIQNGNCEMAIAGGINVMLTPTLHISFSKAGMLSKDGRCKTFAQSADGYVRGEGSGAVLLKPLSKAVNDGDHIYAVIKSTAVNHGGKTSSLTAPNPQAQANLLIKAYEKAGIDPNTVTYIEAHGTGTNLGDPIEINGLKSAFSKMLKKLNKPLPSKPYCGIGSVKTNIGHLETAAGIAGVFKVVLSMKNKQIPSSLHSGEINPYIKLENSPFYVTKKTQPWNELRDEKNQSIPRRAGISSFGFGGVNAHIVLEEYIPPAKISHTALKKHELIVLSAKNEERLMNYASSIIDYVKRSSNSLQVESTEKGTKRIEGDLLTITSSIIGIPVEDFDAKDPLWEYGFDRVHFSKLFEEINRLYGLELTHEGTGRKQTIREISEYLYYLCKPLKNDYCIEKSSESIPGVSLNDMAYTLQIGREEMEARMAFVASSYEELLDKLKVFVSKSEDEGIFRGYLKGKRVKNNSEETKVIADPENVQSLNDLAKRWVTGEKIDWNELHKAKQSQRIPLPSYPFERERYWLPEASVKKGNPLSEARPIDINDDEQIMNLLQLLEQGVVKVDNVKQLIGAITQ